MGLMKIGIMGSGGTGKTLTGFKLAQHLGVPFLASREITNEILKRDGYQYNIQVEKFLAQSHRQIDILTKVKDREDSHNQFITDRTLVDLAVYAIIELHNTDPKMLGKILRICKKHSKQYSHMFVCPWAGIDMRRNNLARTLNPYYQLLVQHTQVGLLQDWNIGFHLLQSEDADGRVEEMKKYL
jgi:hypothetical protein